MTNLAISRKERIYTRKIEMQKLVKRKEWACGGWGSVTARQKRSQDVSIMSICKLRI
jgi:hypothetical protein